jgi:GT2 family glycosyltransferase
MELVIKIDVVVPIYNAYNVLCDCLESISQNQHFINKVILINDASTDERIVSLIDKYGFLENWIIINHKVNKGFVYTANEGLKKSKHHTILLNSDTVVSKNWVKAFRDSIIKNQQLGTATAWSNNAEICSFPKFLTNNKKLNKINSLSEILYDFYKPQYPKIPTAVGFCMLITKQAKDIVGLFNENYFGHGYGEENDYSMRVEVAGLKNILCDNAYVTHVGNESFKELGLKPDENTMKRLLKIHPDYLEKINKYIVSDPLESIRKEILEVISKRDNRLFNELFS